MLKSDWRENRYLFHVHTTFADGQLTVPEYVAFAGKAGAKSVIFLEHIRREPRYDVARFSSEVMQSGSGPVQTVLGFEAKLHPDGTLDINEDCLESAAVIGIAEHAFPNDRRLLREAVLNVVRTYPLRWPRVTFVWVHPGLWYLKHNLIAEHDDAFHEMLAAACDAGVLVERNLRYNLLSQQPQQGCLRNSMSWARTLIRFPTWNAGRRIILPQGLWIMAKERRRACRLSLTRNSE